MFSDMIGIEIHCSQALLYQLGGEGVLPCHSYATYVTFNHKSHLSTLSSHLTVIIGRNLLSSFFIFILNPKNVAKFHFFTVNNIVLSQFSKDQYAPQLVLQ